MKKVVLFLSILMISLAGIFVGCNEDPYADLQVVVSSVTYASTGEEVEYDSTNDCYVLYYKDQIKIQAKATSSSAISSQLVFKNYSESSLQKVSQTSTSLSLSAQTPSKGNTYRVNIASIESSNGNVDLYFKVVVPTTSISVNDNLAVTYGSPLNILSNVSYDSSYLSSGDSKDLVDEKGVEYVLKEYTTTDDTTYSLVSDDDENYYLLDTNGTRSTAVAFSISNGVLSVEDSSLQGGNVSVEVLSENYDKTLDATLADNNTLTQAEKDALTTANNQLKSVVGVELVEGITLDDISFWSVNSKSGMVAGGQYAYGTTNSDVKLSGLLYNNSASATYEVNGTSFSYLYDIVAFKLENVDQNVSVSAVSGSMVQDGTTLKSDDGVFTLENLCSTTSNLWLFKFSANKAGTAYIDFVITFEDFSNTISFNFSDLYANYLDSLDAGSLSDLEDYQKTTKLVLDVSSLPTALNVTEDGTDVSTLSNIKIYDTYATEYGQKFIVNLTTNAGTANEDKVVRVFVNDNSDAEADVSSYFVVRNGSGTIKNLSVDENGVAYFDLDLSKTNGNSFYIKANSSSFYEGKEYSLSFENVLSTKVVAYDGSDVTSNIENKSTSFDFTTNKGVSQILVGVVIGSTFYSLDNTKTTNNGDAYKSLVVNYNGSSVAKAEDGTLFCYMIDDSLSSDIELTYGSSYLTVYSGVTSSVYDATTFTNVSGASQDFTSYTKTLVSVVGKKLGNTQLTITAENGYSVTMNVSVVSTFASDLALYASENYGNTESNITDGVSTSSVDTGRIVDDTVNIKVGGAFDLTYKATSDRTAVIGQPVYSSSDASVATISSSGKVVALKEGTTTLSFTLTYYTFTKVDGNNYYQWTPTSVTKTFELFAFVPSTTKGLSKYSVNVYSYDSLGIDYKDYANVSVNVKLDSNSTIVKSAYIGNVTYALSATGYLKTASFNTDSDEDGATVGRVFEANAYLYSGEQSKKVYITFTIDEFGSKTTLVCVVNITKATQVENISLSGKDDDGDTLVMNEYQGSTDSFVTSARVGDTLKFTTAVSPTDAFVKVLTVAIYSVKSDMTLGSLDTTLNTAKLTYNSLVNQYSVSTKGADSFSVNVTSSTSGYFYIYIYSNDSISNRTLTDGVLSSIETNVYLKLLVEITDGSLEHQYVIYDADDLADIANEPAKNYVLGSNISLSGAWTPIQNFTGTLNGYNAEIGEFYKITGLQLTSIGSNNIGLFATIGTDGTTYGAVMNLKVEANTISLSGTTTQSGEINIGVIAGTNNGLILNSSVTLGTFSVGITSNEVNVGGMVGVNNGGIFNFTPSLSVTEEQLVVYSASAGTGASGIMAIYKDGAVLNEDSLDDCNLIGSTPVFGSMTVSDSTNHSVCVGGFAGKNAGYIDGVYGLYNVITETSTSDLFTNFEEESYDANININYNGTSTTGKIVNSDSTIGGVAGSVTAGYISNVATYGRIGTLTLNSATTSSALLGAMNNVGGVVGKVSGNASQVVIENVLASVIVRGKENVGGVAGIVNNTLFETVRVENFGDSTDKNLVAGETYVGGIAGKAINSAFELAYSYTFVDKLGTSYKTYGDVYAYGNAPIAGGVAGYVSQTGSNTAYLKQVISNFNVESKSTISSGNLAGLVGLVEYSSATILKFEDFAYVGVVMSLTGLNTDAVCNVKSGTTTVGGYTLSSNIYENYYYYYLLQYGTDGTASYLYVPQNSEDMTYFSDSADESSMGDGVYSTDDYISFTFKVFDETSSSYVEQTISKKGFVYDVLFNSITKTCNFLKTVPTSISISINGEEATLQGSYYELAFETDSNKNYYYGYTSSGSQFLVLRYSKQNNTFKLSDLFGVSATPSGISKFGLTVASGDASIISILSSGSLVVNKSGTVTLTISLKEDPDVKVTINVVVVTDFDELVLSSSGDFADSYFDYTENNALDVAVNSALNISNNLLGKVAQSSSIISSNGEDENYIETTIANKTSYSVGYVVWFFNEDVEEYQDVSSNSEYVSISGQELTFAKTGTYKIEARVSITVNSVKYTFTDSNWVFYFSVVSKATAISFGNIESITLKGTETASEEINLTSTSPVDIAFDVTDSEGNDCNAVFDISVTSAENATASGDGYIYTMLISLSEEYKGASDVATTYTIKAFDEQENLKSSPATLSVVVGPQSVEEVSLVHYAYTDETSKLVSSMNTETYSGPNYSYSYVEDSSSYIVSGGEGLLVIDIYPYYANISSVVVESSLGSSGSNVQFVQMVQIGTNKSSNYYINGPETTAVDNGISLNMVSYVPEDVATLNIDLNDQFSLEYASGVSELSYLFGTDDSASAGRLYVKTIAPSSLSSLSSFVVTVTVTYTSLNDDYSVSEKTLEENLTLSVETVPGLSLDVTHGDKAREVIAYTGDNSASSSGADYLTLTPVTTDEQEFKEIQVSVTRDNNQFDDASDYASVFDNNDGTYTLSLGSSALVGDIITLKLIATVTYNGDEIEKSYIVSITVVDVVVNSISIKDADSSENLKLTIATSKSLKVVVEGYGLDSYITNLENSIARSMNETGVVRYWYANVDGNGYVSLNGTSSSGTNVEDSLPFSIEYISLESGSTTESEPNTVDSKCVGVSTSQKTIEFYTTEQVIVMVAGTETDSVDMRLAFSYVYKDGEVLLVPNYVTDTTYYYEQDFTIFVTQGEEEENLSLVENEDDFKGMSKNGNYILMNDITLENYEAIDAEFASFDGNNKIITIKNFKYSTNLASSTTSYSINLGLFDTVSSGTIIKNVIVALPNDRTESSDTLYESAMDLTGYSTVNFGGLAAVNNGIVTNCEVISVFASSEDKDDYTSAVNNYNNTVGTYNYGYTFGYTLYVKTSNTATVNIGGLVGINGSTGIITNSRVGRDEVTVLSTDDDDGSVLATESDYALTASRTIISVYGAGNVGSFVAENDGSISSSYAKNIQMEVFTDSTSKNIATAGFVVTNNGYIYGSYVSGWEEVSTSSQASDNRKLGGGIYSNGTIAGFVYENSNYIEDCYANINLSGSYIFAAPTAKIVSDYSSNGSTEAVAPTASGFVYKMDDSGYIYTSYSLCKIVSTLNTHTYFEGNLQNSGDATTDETLGTVEDCYYLKESSETTKDSVEPRAWELSDNPTDTSGVQSSGLNEFVNEDSFNGFSFDNGTGTFDEIVENSSGGVWTIYSDGLGGYPELISANKIAISCRVAETTPSTEDEYVNSLSLVYVENYDIGSSNNPYLISSFSEYNSIFEDVSAQGTLSDDVSSSFTGCIRLINNIEFPTSTKQSVYSSTVEYTSTNTTNSVFDGNYLAMYNITLTDSNVGKSSFGLFRDIYGAGVKNLTLGINSITAGNSVAVGGLAGVIVDSNISNIKVVSASSSSTIKGKNYVGALAGIILASTYTSSYSVSGIKTNISIVGDITSDISSSITSSFSVWQSINPNTDDGVNLNLSKLDSNVSYAGGVAGVVDLRQFSELDEDAAVTEPNVSNIEVGKMVQSSSLSGSLNFENANVNVVSYYAGGLFGFVGTQTYVMAATFVVGSTSELTSYQVAGGITAVNFGTLSKTSVTYGDTTLEDYDSGIVNYVAGVEYDLGNANSTLFGGEPLYIGGLVGINAGSEITGSGRILDSYNNVDVKNDYALNVGGIAGASYIGEMKNVYTTASLMGDLTSDELYMGSVVGRIFENSPGEYFQDASTSLDLQLDFTYVVALNVWDPDDFDELYTYTSNGGVIGSLYGYYTNAETGSNDLGIVRVNDGVYVQTDILDSFNYDYISLTSIDESEFDASQLATDDTDEDTHYIELWGVGDGDNNDTYLSSVLSGNSGENLVYPNKVQDLLNGLGTSSLRDIYFSSDNWLESTWDYSTENLLPLLQYGYISSLVKIYTAEQFVSELSSANTLSKKYMIMNDIDFSGVDLSVFTEPFRGALTGNLVTIEQDGKEYSRYPILFNMSFSSTDQETDFALFQNTVDATISNLNFVISSYSVAFAQSLTETKAGILVANAINTTITNVNIYSSLNDIVNADISSTPETLSGVTHYVTSGVNVNALNDVVGYSSPFLQVVTLDPTVDTSTSTSARELHYQYFFVYSGSSTTNTKTTYTYILSYALDTLVEDGDNIAVSNLNIGVNDYTSISNTENTAGMITNASTVGQFVAASDTSSLTLSNATTTLNMTVIYNSNEVYRTKYVGAFVGNCIGSLSKLFSSGDISITTNYSANEIKGDLDTLYAGGVVGRMQGSMEYIFTDDVNLNIGSSTRKLITSNTSSGGFFIGGLVGGAGEFVSLDSGVSVTGSISDVSIVDLGMNVYVVGKASIAGAVAQDRYNIVNLTIKQLSGEENKDMNVYLGEKDVNYYVGGVVGESLASELDNIYTNLNVSVIAELSDAMYVGGIVATLSKSCAFVNVINDADYVSVSRVAQDKYYVPTTLAIGGITGGANGSNASTITLNKVVTYADIECDQEKEMYVGGAVGKAEKISLSNVIVLGNVSLNRGKGTTSGSYFYTDPSTDEDYVYYIGGLVGMYSKYVCGETEGSTLVVSTIRDYAIAQKLDLNIGSVVGRINIDNSTSTDALVSHKNGSKTYYNEGVSLVNCGTYVDDEFTNVAQAGLLDIFQRIYENIMIKSDSFELAYDSTYYSKLHTSYYTSSSDVTSAISVDSNYVSGSKINPIVYTSGVVLQDNKYYILTSDLTLTSSISTTATGWVFNAQGYSAVCKNKALFDTITENSAVSSVFTTLSSTTASGVSSYGPIAKTNYGFVFSCGTSGTISGSNGLAGLVYTNYGVISSSFSIASITATSGAGLVLNNGKSTDDYIGNIYDSYFTGTVSSVDSDKDGSYFSGFVMFTTYGVISNCYTMADVEAENKNIAPIAYLNTTNTSENIYRTYYDYSTTSFDSQEGVSANSSAVDLSNNIECISSKGFYVYSYSLSGERSSNAYMKSYVTSSSMFSTHWIVPDEDSTSDSELQAFFKLSGNYTSNTSEKLLVDTTWFNYAYITKNYKNVILASQLDDYFDMIYTGNGLADASNTTTKTNGFLDKPYSIKHAGMLEMYMLVNYLKTTPEYKYYIFVKNINFEKYSYETYWSEQLDNMTAYFVGDLDGDGNIVYNMYSSNGLLRALPSIDGVNTGYSSTVTVRQTYVHDITFTACYSQTGLVAGYMGSGHLEGIDVDSSIAVIGGNSYVYNGDLFNVVETGVFKETEVVNNATVDIELFSSRVSSLTVTFNGTYSSITKSVSGDDEAFAGGLIGYMDGGEISTTPITDTLGNTTYVGADFMGLFVMVNDRNYEDTSYAGGLVGVMVGGSIYGTEEDAFTVQGISVYSCLDNGTLTDSNGDDEARAVSSSHIGGVVGLLSAYKKTKGLLSYISVSTATDETSSVGLYGYYTMGGIVGYNDGGEVTNCVYDAENEFNVADVLVAKGTDGKATITKNTVDSSIIMKNLIANEIYIGGIAGKFESGLIEDCEYGENASFTVTVKYLGGYHSVIFGGIVGDIYQSSNSNTVVINNCTSSGRATIYSIKTSIAGGIVGRMRGGTVTNCTTGKTSGSGTNSFTTAVYFDFSSSSSSWLNASNITNWGDNVTDFETLWNNYWGSLDWLHGTFTDYSTETSLSISYDGMLTSSGKAVTIYSSASIGATFSVYGYSVTGGIVGRMYYGTIDGTGESDDDYTISNSASITASSSAGGIVGEVLVSESDGSDKVIINHVQNTGYVSAVSVFNISATVSAGTTIRDTYNIDSSFSKYYDKTTSLSSAISLLLDAGLYIGFKTSNAGGIAGYVYSATGSSTTTAVVTISDCSNTATMVGGILSTFVGGIVGISADASSSEHIQITNCNSTSSLLGYSLRSFAGGIVGYTNYTTVKDCTVGSLSMIIISSDGSTTNIFTALANAVSGKEDDENTEAVLTNFLTSLSALSSVPYIVGGVVGYVQNGYIVDCSTAMGMNVGLRVAGGIVGVMAGGILESTGIMANESVVIAISGIAGGIVGLMRGGAISTSYSTKISTLFSSLLSNVSDLLSGDLSLSSLASQISGIMMNSATGVIIGNVSGGIIGYYEHMVSITNNVESDDPELAGVVNLGSVFSGIGMILSSNSVASVASVSDSLTDALNGSASAISDAFSSVKDWVSTNVDKFLGDWGLSLKIDGSTVYGMSTSFLDCFSINLNNVVSDFNVGIDLGFSGYDISDYLSGVVVPKFAWTSDYGLIYPGWTSTGELSTNASSLMSKYNFNMKEEDLNGLIGQGACGGIIGIVKTTDTLTLDAVISYAVSLKSSGISTSSLFTIASGRIASSGSAGGLVGASLVDDSESTEQELIISFALNFTPVLGRENAGGIVGYAESRTYLFSGGDTTLGDILDGSYVQDGYLRGWIANYGSVNATSNAGGIIGRSVGAHLNTEDVEKLYSAHIISLVGSAGGFVSEKELYSATTSSYYNFCPYITNSGTVFGAQRSGGIVGYATDGTSMYFCKTTQSLMSFLSGIVSTDSAMSTLFSTNMFISGSKYVGGLVGELDGGKISGTCYVGGNSSTLSALSRVLKVTIYGFAEEDAENESCAGGIVGKTDASSIIGGLAGNTGSQTTLYVYVDENVSFGAYSSYTSSLVAFYPAYVGGSIGCVTSDLPESYYVEIACTVSGGEKAVGGWFGLVDLGESKTLDLSKTVDGVTSNTMTNTTLIVEGTKVTIADNLEDALSGLLSSDGSIDFAGASAIGGVIGYLKSGTLTGVTVVSSVSGETGNIVGGVVGKLGADAKINNVYVEAESSSGEAVYSTLVSGSKVTNKTVSNNALALGGIVGYMEGGYIDNSAVTKVVLSGAKYVGGVVGYMYSGTIGTVSGGEIGSATYGGGIVGYLEGNDCDFVNTQSKGVYLSTEAQTVVSGNTDYAGGFVGYMNGGSLELDNVAFYSTSYEIVYGNYVAGGLVAEMGNGTILSGDVSSVTISTGSVADSEGNYPVSGGLVGKMTGGTLAGGTAPDISGSIVGGLVGWMTSGSSTSSSGTVTTIGTISGGTPGKVTASSGAYYAGGFVGKMEAGTITGGDIGENSLVTNESNGKVTYLGGIVGFMTGGDISAFVQGVTVQGVGADSTIIYGGGVIGGMTSKSSDDIFNYDDDNVIGGEVSGVTYGGGLVGLVASGIISSTVSSATVSADYAGGIVGAAYYYTSSTSDKYYGVTINVDSVSNVNLTGKTAVGGVIGYAENSQIAIYGTAISISGTYAVTGSTNYVGGVVGVAKQTRLGSYGIPNEIESGVYAVDLLSSYSSYATTVTLTNITLSSTSGTTFGGVIGKMTAGSVFTMILAGDDSVDLGSEVKTFGGIVGENVSESASNVGFIYSCKNTFDLTLDTTTEDSSLGGIVGTNAGYVYMSTNSADITSNFKNIGGIAGTLTGSICASQNGEEGETAVVITGVKTSNAGGLAGSASGEAKITSGCVNYGTIELGSESVASGSPVDTSSSSAWASSSDISKVNVESESETFTNASDFSSKYSGSVGGLVGTISDNAYIAGESNGSVLGFYYYAKSTQAGESATFGSRTETANIYEIVDRRGSLVGYNSTGSDGTAVVKNEGTAVEGSWTTGILEKTFYWSDTDSTLTEKEKTLQETYVVELTVETADSVAYTQEGSTLYQYGDIQTSQYSIYSTTANVETLKSTYDSLGSDYSTIMSNVSSMTSSGFQNVNATTLAGTRSTELSKYGLVTDSVYNYGIQEKSNIDYEPTAGQGVSKVKVTFKVYKVLTLYYKATYSSSSLQDTGGDITYTRDIYTKDEYCTDLTSKSVALEELYELSNYSSSSNIDDEWSKQTVPTGVLFKYTVKIPAE